MGNNLTRVLPLWVDYTTANREGKREIRMCLVVVASTVVIISLFIVFWSVIPVWAAASLLALASAGTVFFGAIAFGACIEGEVKARSRIKATIKRHVDYALDYDDVDMTLSERFRMNQDLEGREWAALSPRCLRWIEKTYQMTLKEETKARAEKTYLDNDGYGALAFIDNVGDVNSRAIGSTKKFLESLDEIQSQEKIELDNSSRGQLDDFDEQMKKASA